MDLVNRLCVRFGWCGAIGKDGIFRCVEDLLPERGTLSADDFARLVIIADGEDPEGELSLDRAWIKLISAEFRKTFGRDSIDIQELDLL